MLLSFTLDNHRSFREAAELSFVATGRKDEPVWRMPSRYAANGVLPVVGVWGANASGKTNLIHALLFVRSAVRDSHARWEATSLVPWSPWGLRTDVDARPSRFELELLVDDVRFTFGFEVLRGAFVEEHLYRWEGTRRQVLYSRNVSESEPWYFGPGLKGQRTRIAESTRANSLFLSAAAQANHPLLLTVYEAIVEGIRSGGPIGLRGYPIFNEAHPILAKGFRDSLVQLLSAADVGITGVEIEQRQGEPEPGEVTQGEDRRFIRLVHGKENAWTLPPEEESRGTQILLARLADFVVTLRQGELLVLDEIDTSLHPDLCAALVALFTNGETNRKGAQLLFSTHDRDLLKSLRTDEVVLVDKGQDGASSLATASDYRGVRTREDLRRVHEEGRLRGVPVLGDLARAFGGELS